jgi:hypothetical protein
MFVVTMAYLIGCEHPAHPPADGSSPADGSADNVVVEFKFTTNLMHNFLFIQ